MMDRKIVSSNLIWRFLERFGAQGVTFIVSIVLARVLDPSIYGTVALITVITTILQVFVDSGLGNALIQKKNSDDIDFSTVFYSNVIICTILYLLLFSLSPAIAKFYESDELVPLIRVLGILIVISGFKNIQNAYVSKHLLFKKYFFSTLVGTVVAAVVGIWMAYNNFGVWALIAQNIANQTIDTIILWITVKWRPKFVFSFSRLKSLFSYGWKLLASSLLDTIWAELRQLIIGKKYTSNDLSFYNKGQEYPKYATSAISTSIDSVLLPTMSSVQDNILHVKSMARRAIKVSTYIMMPLMVGLAMCAQPAINLILTEKWAPCVFFLRIFCFTYAFYPMHTANLNAIKAIGRSDIYLTIEIIKKIIGLIAIIVTMWISVDAMAYSLLATSIISQIINSWPNKKLLGYGYGEQLKDMLPQIGLSCFMGAVVYCINLLNLSDILTLLIQIPLGILIYVAGSKIFHIDSFDYILSIAKQYLPKKKNKA